MGPLIDMSLFKHRGVNPEEYKTNLRAALDQVGEHLIRRRSVSQLLNKLVLERTTFSPQYSLTALEDLRVLLLRANEEGLSEEKRDQLNTIRGICDEIIAANDIDEQNPIANNLSREMILNILSKSTVKKMGQLRRVKGNWNELSLFQQIESINANQPKMADLFPGKTAKEIVQWLSTHPNRGKLHHADFSDLEEFDHETLLKLVNACPNLKVLLIKNCVDVVLRALEKTESREQQLLLIDALKKNMEVLSVRNRASACSKVVEALQRWNESTLDFYKFPFIGRFDLLKCIQVNLLNNRQQMIVGGIVEQFLEKDLWFEDYCELCRQIAIEHAVPLLAAIKLPSFKIILRNILVGPSVGIEYPELYPKTAYFAGLLIAYQTFDPEGFQTLDSSIVLNRFFIGLVTSLTENPEQAKQLENTPFSIANVNAFLLQEDVLCKSKNHNFFKELCLKSPPDNGPFHSVCCHWIMKVFHPIDSCLNLMVVLLNSRNSDIAKAATLRIEQVLKERKYPYHGSIKVRIRDIMDDQTGQRYGVWSQNEFLHRLFKFAASVDRSILHIFIAAYFETNKVREAVWLLRLYFDPESEPQMPLEVNKPFDCSLMIKRFISKALGYVNFAYEQEIYNILKAGLSQQFGITNELLRKGSPVNASHWNGVLSLKLQEEIISELQQRRLDWAVQTISDSASGLTFGLNGESFISEKERKCFVDAVCMIEKYGSLTSDTLHQEVLKRLNPDNALSRYLRKALAASDIALHNAQICQLKQELIGIAERFEGIPRLPSLVITMTGDLGNISAVKIRDQVTGSDGQIFGTMKIDPTSLLCLRSYSSITGHVNWSTSLSLKAGKETNRLCLAGSTLVVSVEEQGSTSLLAIDTTTGDVLSEYGFGKENKIEKLTLIPDKPNVLAAALNGLFLIDVSVPGALSVKRLPFHSAQEGIVPYGDVPDLVHLESLLYLASVSPYKIFFVGENMIWSREFIFCCSLDGNLRFKIPFNRTSKWRLEGDMLYYNEGNELIVYDIEKNIELQRLSLREEAFVGQMVMSPDSRFACVQLRRCAFLEENRNKDLSLSIQVIELATEKTVLFLTEKDVARSIMNNCTISFTEDSQHLKIHQVGLWDNKKKEYSFKLN